MVKAREKEGGGGRLARTERDRLSYLNYDASKGRVTAPDDGETEGGAGPRYLHVGHLPLQDGQPRDS